MPTYEDAASPAGESNGSARGIKANRLKTGDPNNLPHRDTAVQWNDAMLQRSPGMEVASAVSGEIVAARSYKGHSCGYADCPKCNKG